MRFVSKVHAATKRKPKFKVGDAVYFPELKKEGKIDAIGGAGSPYGKDWAMVRWKSGTGSWIHLDALEPLGVTAKPMSDRERAAKQRERTKDIVREGRQYQKGGGWGPKGGGRSDDEEDPVERRQGFEKKWVKDQLDRMVAPKATAKEWSHLKEQLKKVTDRQHVIYEKYNPNYTHKNYDFEGPDHKDPKEFELKDRAEYERLDRERHKLSDKLSALRKKLGIG